MKMEERDRTILNNKILSFFLLPSSLFPLPSSLFLLPSLLALLKSPVMYFLELLVFWHFTATAESA
jgi:hypothetical protein